MNSESDRWPVEKTPARIAKNGLMNLTGCKVREEAIIASAKNDAAVAAKLDLELLYDSNEKVACAAAELLGDIGSEHALDTMVRLRGEASNQLRATPVNCPIADRQTLTEPGIQDLHPE